MHDCFFWRFRRRIRTNVPQQRLIGHIKNLVAKWPSIVQYMYLSYVVDQVYKRADLGYLACIGAGGPF